MYHTYILVNKSPNSNQYDYHQIEKENLGILSHISVEI